MLYYRIYRIYSIEVFGDQASTMSATTSSIISIAETEYTRRFVLKKGTVGGMEASERRPIVQFKAVFELGGRTSRRLTYRPGLYLVGQKQPLSARHGGS